MPQRLPFTFLTLLFITSCALEEPLETDSLYEESFERYDTSTFAINLTALRGKMIEFRCDVWGWDPKIHASRKYPFENPTMKINKSTKAIGYDTINWVPCSSYGWVTYEINPHSSCSSGIGYAAEVFPRKHETCN